MRDGLVSSTDEWSPDSRVLALKYIIYHGYKRSKTEIRSGLRVIALVKDFLKEKVQ